MRRGARYATNVNLFSQRPSICLLRYIPSSPNDLQIRPMWEWQISLKSATSSTSGPSAQSFLRCSLGFRYGSRSRVEWCPWMARRESIWVFSASLAVTMQKSWQNRTSILGRDWVQSCPRSRRASISPANLGSETLCSSTYSITSCVFTQVSAYTRRRSSSTNSWPVKCKGTNRSSSSSSSLNNSSA